MKKSTLFTLKTYLAHVKKNRAMALTSFIMIPSAIVLLQSLVPYFLSQSIGSVQTKSSEEVYSILIYGAIAAVVGVLFNFIGFQALFRYEGKVIVALRNHVFAQLINNDIGFFINEKVGGLTSKYSDFIRGFIAINTIIIIRTLGFFLTLLIGLVVIAQQSLVIAGVLIALIAVLIIEVRWSMRVREPWRTERIALRSQTHAKVADAMSNSVAVKVFAGEDREVASLKETGKKFLRAHHKDLGFLSSEGSIRLAIMTLAQITAISVAVSMVLNGTLDVATAIFSVTYLQLVGNNIFDIPELLNGVEQALLEAEPMSNILMRQKAVEDAKNAPSPKTLTPTVDFTDVTFCYDDNKDVALNNVSLSVAKGEKIGLVGHSGAGKSTIVQLLLRFYDVNEGAIKVGGYDIRDITQKSLRKNIAYVPQEPYMFHRTVKENIAYGKPNATDEEVVAAAKKAHAMEFIEKLPHGLGTIVGERGVKLSGGQRQRIAIARAIIKDAPILVLDEATSALDSESEHLIQESLDKLMKDRTSIVIAHRLSTIAKLDRILVLEKGSIVENGAHDELLKDNKTYASLWKHQSGGFIQE